MRIELTANNLEIRFQSKLKKRTRSSNYVMHKNVFGIARAPHHQFGTTISGKRGTIGESIQCLLCLRTE
jgi:hypothetical protein